MQENRKLNFSTSDSFPLLMSQLCLCANLIKYTRHYFSFTNLTFVAPLLYYNGQKLLDSINFNNMSPSHPPMSTTNLCHLQFRIEFSINSITLSTWQTTDAKCHQIWQKFSKTLYTINIFKIMKRNGFKILSMYKHAFSICEVIWRIGFEICELMMILK